MGVVAMPANIVCSPGTAPWLDPDTVSLSSPQDVWFQAVLANDGDEAGDTGSLTYSDQSGAIQGNFPSVTINPGDTPQQGVNISGSDWPQLGQADTWITLYDANGGTLGGARFTINP